MLLCFTISVKVCGAKEGMAGGAVLKTCCVRLCCQFSRRRITISRRRVLCVRGGYSWNSTARTSQLTRASVARTHSGTVKHHVRVSAMRANQRLNLPAFGGMPDVRPQYPADVFRRRRTPRPAPAGGPPNAATCMSAAAATSSWCGSGAS